MPSQPESLQREPSLAWFVPQSVPEGEVPGVPSHPGLMNGSDRDTGRWSFSYTVNHFGKYSGVLGLNPSKLEHIRTNFSEPADGAKHNSYKRLRYLHICCYFN